MVYLVGVSLPLLRRGKTPDEALFHVKVIARSLHCGCESVDILVCVVEDVDDLELLEFLDAFRPQEEPAGLLWLGR